MLLAFPFLSIYIYIGSFWTFQWLSFFLLFIFPFWSIDYWSCRLWLLSHLPSLHYCYYYSIHLLFLLCISIVTGINRLLYDSLYISFIYISRLGEYVSFPLRVCPRLRCRQEFIGVFSLHYSWGRSLIPLTRTSQ